MSDFGFLRTSNSQTPRVVTIAFDDDGLALHDQRGRSEWYSYAELIARKSQGDPVVLGRRFRPGFRLDLSGATAREYRARIPLPESRWSRLRRWATRSPKKAALAILIPGFLLEHIPGPWVAPITPTFLAARLDSGIDDYVKRSACRSNNGQAALDTLVRRLVSPQGTKPRPYAVEQSHFFVSARIGGQMLVDRVALVEIEVPVLTALIGHEFAHIENGDLIRAAGRGEGTRFVEHIFLGSYFDRAAEFEFSAEEEARADRSAIDLLHAKRIAIAPAAAFFARNEKARREGTYWAQAYTNVHPGIANRASTWTTAALRQGPTQTFLSERESDDLFNICWKRPEGTHSKWST